jgi:hypothetical protein
VLPSIVGRQVSLLRPWWSATRIITSNNWINQKWQAADQQRALHPILEHHNPFLSNADAWFKSFKRQMRLSYDPTTQTGRMTLLGM